MDGGTIMELLKFDINGLKLYKSERFSFDFVAKQRATDNNSDSLTNIFNRIYVHNVMSVVGINAVGKTTALSITNEIIKVYLSGEGFTDMQHAFIGKEFNIKVYLFDDNEKRIYLVNSELKKSEDNKFEFTNESIFEKGISGVTKKNLCDFSNSTATLERNEIESGLLPDNFSVFRKILNKSKRSNNKPESLYFNSFLSADYLLGQEFVSTEVLSYLDPSIEYFKVVDDTVDESKKQYRLKFYSGNELRINSVSELSQYFSSGTLKGIALFTVAWLILETGSVLLVDELENHFNKAIVKTFISIFQDKTINKNNAKLVFTTHYPELLDAFDRNDDVLIARRQEKMTLDNLAELLDRNDFKKSEVFESDYLGGTAPNYDLMMSVRKSFNKKFGNHDDK